MPRRRYAATTAATISPALDCLHFSHFSQGNIKRDPAGYSDEFQMQWRHYKACLALFLLKPDQPGGEFSELVNFIAQVSNSYPQHTGGFAAEISELLDKHHAVLEPTLRQVRSGRGLEVLHAAAIKQRCQAVRRAMAEEMCTSAARIVTALH
jgi:hypothetical protein